MAPSIFIKVPASSANIGPGFDVIGLALNLYLEVNVTIDKSSTIQAPLNCQITYQGLGAEEISLDPEANLITRTALYVLRCNGQRSFPPLTRIHVSNPIPLGRGLGSSGAAVVAGVNLANQVGQLSLPQTRLLDYCLMIERHPDNVAAALYGGFVGTYLSDLSDEDLKRKEIPLSEVLPEPAGGLDTGLQPPEPPHGIGHFKKFKWAKEIKCIAVIPDFEVSTAAARAVLPTTYSRADLVFNMQRIALLATALGESPPDPDMIFLAMQDKVHQPYRKGLIPALPGILGSMNPKSHPGLLGICLSGAGPSILALATENFESIANEIIAQFKEENVTCQWTLLEPALDGMTVSYSSPSEKPTVQGMTYAAAGVSINAGNELVERIKLHVKKTARPGADATIGGFGGCIDLHKAGFENGPILVQAIDGVGTKLKIAFALNNHSTVGIDLVAMNVNDLVVQGAEPITFMDYYATNKLSVDVAASFVEGVAEGCRQAHCALVGGETAEMPDMYSEDEYDVAGAATGAIPRGRKILPDLDSMVNGDLLLGLASSGVHSNGFSLVRRILARQQLKFTDTAPWNSSTSVGLDLLTPTKIYARPCLALVKKHLAKGMAHITGGGLVENIPRMLPPHLSAHVNVASWNLPGIFSWLKQAGRVEPHEMSRVWNCGVGMVIIVAAEHVEEAIGILQCEGETVYQMGVISSRQDGEDLCVLEGVESWQ